MKKEPSQPAPPSPAATAAAQSGANKEAVIESARVNQIRQVTPYGEVSYSGEIGSPDRTMTTTLTPEGQAQLANQNQLAAQLGGLALNRAGQIDTGTLNFDGLPAYASGVDMSGLPSLPGYDDFAGDATRQEEAAFNRAWNRLSPQFDQERTALETQLANQGIGVGTDAYSRAVSDFDRNKNDARIAAAYDAISAGEGLRHGRLADVSALRTQGLNELLQNASMQNAARLQGMSERQTLRSQPINELAAILQGTPALGTPQFSAPAQYQVAPADIQGATQAQYAGNMAGYQARLGQQNANTAAGAGLLGAGAMAGAYW